MLQWVVFWSTPSVSLAANTHSCAFLQLSANSFEMNTYRISISNSFRMNTYRKTGGGGPSVPNREFFARRRDSIVRGRCLEIRDQKEHGQQRNAERKSDVKRFHAMQLIKDDGRNDVTELLQNTHQHQQP